MHHPVFLSVLPLGARLRCCGCLWSWLRLRLRLGFWDAKMLGDCIIIHDVPCEKQLVGEDMYQAPDTPGCLRPDDMHSSWLPVCGLVGSPRCARRRVCVSHPLPYRGRRTTSRCANRRGGWGRALGQGARACRWGVPRRLSSPPPPMPAARDHSRCLCGGWGSGGGGFLRR